MNEVITKVFLECARAIDASELITRVSSTDKDTNLKLWRIRASRLRCFTDREYARLQTFPDTWVFHGDNKRHIHKQIGNAVAVQFALRIANFLKVIHEAQRSGKAMSSSGKGRNTQIELAF